MLLKSVRHYVGAYAAELGKVDAIVFTAGIGENDADLREKVCASLGFMGVKIDAEKNNVRGKEVEISTADSAVKVFIIPTDEEMMIAIYQMIDDGVDSDYLVQFELIFDKFSENIYQNSLRKRDSRLATLSSSSLVASCYLMIVLTIGIIANCLVTLISLGIIIYYYLEIKSTPYDSIILTEKITNQLGFRTFVNFNNAKSMKEF